MQTRSTSAESIFTNIWRQRGLAACLLWPVSLVFRALSGLRRKLYAAGVLTTIRLPVPVIVVGNIYVGGTGKTPLVISLVETLRAAGHVPGVVSRGHGTSGATPLLVRPDSRPHDAGDEPVLIAIRARCPVAVGRDRVAAARLLLATHPEVNVIVSDDGLQHYRLGRDLEIALFDSRGVGNGWMLPAGPLREPVSRKVDFVIVNGQMESAPPAAAAMQLEGGSAERLSDRSQRVALSSLSAAADGAPARCLAAAGIGNPERFFAMLRGAGLNFQALPLPDHYDFADNPFADVTADVILITEKDAVKCCHIDALKSDSRLWVVPVTAHIEAGVTEKILEKLRGHTTA